MKCKLNAEKKIFIELHNNRSIGIEQTWSCETDGKTVPVSDLALKSCREIPYPASTLELVEQSDYGLLCEYFYSAGEFFSMSAVVTNTGKTAQRLRWRQRFFGLPTADGIFTPTMNGFRELADNSEEIYRAEYRGEIPFEDPRTLSIPMASYLSAATDFGCTLCAHIETPISPFLCRIEPRNKQIILERVILDLQPGETQVLRHYMVTHQGCWRSGLAWVREKFSRFFMLSNKQLIERTHGCFIYSNVANEELCRKFQQEGVKNLEIHYTYPFFGKYVPEEENWISQIDDKWNAIKKTTDPRAPAEDSSYQEIKNYLSGVMKVNMNKQRVSDFIRRLKNHGIQSFLYFMPSECWEFFAKREFPEAIYTNPDGTLAVTWKDHLQLKTAPASRWWYYICRQLEGMLDLYPEADGIFIDQSALDRDNYFVCKITAQLAKIAAQRGKICYWNGPYLVELIEHAVGMLAESGPVYGEMIKYLTIGDKVCCGLGFSEPQFQRNLINGLWPPAPSQMHMRKFRVADEDAHCLPIPEELEELQKRYRYLYELYQGKTWLLEAHALKTSAGVQSNIFQRPEGDYLVALTIPGHSYKSGAALRQVEITVRAKDLAKVKAVYWRSPDLGCEQYAVNWKSEKNEIRIMLPWVGSAGVLWLAFTKQKASALPKSSPNDARGGTAVQRVFSFSISMLGIIHTGNMDDVTNGLKTMAPLPPIPRRKVFLNNQEVGLLRSANSRNWHYSGIWDPFGEINYSEIAKTLKSENELRIEPDGEQDFFKVRDINMNVVLTNGKIIHSLPVSETFSSCAHELAEGIINSPIRITIRFSPTDLKWLEG